MGVRPRAQNGVAKERCRGDMEGFGVTMGPINVLEGGWLGAPSPQGPPMVPAEGGAETFCP